MGPYNEKSEYSSACTVKTTSKHFDYYIYLFFFYTKNNNIFIIQIEEPVNGELFQKAIFLDRKSDLQKMLELPNGHKFLEIPDKFDNLPLMIAIIKNNFELVYYSNILNLI